MTPTQASAFALGATAWLQQSASLLPLFVLGTLIFWVQRWTQQGLIKAIGLRGMIYWTGWLGTPIHEASHVAVGSLFGVRFLEVRLFSPDVYSGVLGYVRYRLPSWRPGEWPQIIGTFLMGIAPLFGGALALLGARWLLIDAAADAPFYAAASAFAADLPTANLETLAPAFAEVLTQGYRPIVDRLSTDPWIWVYLYVSLAIGTHLSPSRADLRGGWRGFILLGVLTFAANVVAVGAGADPTAAVTYVAAAVAPLTTLLVFVLVLNLGHGAVAFVAGTIVSAMRR